MEIEDEPAAVAAAEALEGAAGDEYNEDGGAGGGEEEGGEGEPGTFVEIDLGRLHSAEGLTPCPGCGKSMRKSQLAIHMRNKKCEEYADRLEEALPSVAPILGRVKCPMCAHVSPNLKALRKHYASQHGEKKQCSKCKKEYGRSDALRKHEKTCGEKADPMCACICSPNEPYRSVFNLRAHIKRENANPKNAPNSHAQVTELPAGAVALLSIDAGAVAAARIGAHEPEEEEEDAGAAPADVPEVVM